MLSTPEGRTLYRRRQQIVEPAFAHTKVIRRRDRFLRRGLAACRAEWKLIAATHNLLKLWRAGLAEGPTTTAELGSRLLAIWAGDHVGMPRPRGQSNSHERTAASLSSRSRHDGSSSK
jgi:hypothetical protein